MSNTITQTPSQMHSTLVLHGVPPSAEYTAAAGPDYGYVAAWELTKGYLIQYGNNAQTDYDFADDADDLPAWLESPDLDSLDAIVQTANVRGANAVMAATEDSEGPFYVLVTRHWYGPTETSCFEPYADRPQTALEFLSYRDAHDWIGKNNGGICELSHNESGSPSYKIVAA